MKNKKDMNWGELLNEEIHLSFWFCENKMQPHEGPRHPGVDPGKESNLSLPSPERLQDQIAYLFLISIFFVLDPATFGTLIIKTPLSKVASACSWSISAGS